MGTLSCHLQLHGLFAEQFYNNGYQDVPTGSFVANVLTSGGVTVSISSDNFGPVAVYSWKYKHGV